MAMLAAVLGTGAMGPACRHANCSCMFCEEGSCVRFDADLVGFRYSGLMSVRILISVGE